MPANYFNNIPTTYLFFYKLILFRFYRYSYGWDWGPSFPTVCRFIILNYTNLDTFILDVPTQLLYVPIRRVKRT